MATTTKRAATKRRAATQRAAAARPDAIALFRQVMLASASIPVAFPPVLFDVTAGGRRYDEKLSG